MQTSNRFFDDLAKVAGGAASTLTGLKSEIETTIRHQIQKFASDANLVKREEFDAIKIVAVKARTEQEKLELRLKKLEEKINKLSRQKKTKKPTKKI